MSVQDCHTLLQTLNHVYNSNNPSRRVSSVDWTTLIWIPDFNVQAVLHAIYPGTSRTKELVVYGRPALKRVLERLADEGPGFEATYQQGRHAFRLTFVALNALDNLDDFFDI